MNRTSANAGTSTVICQVPDEVAARLKQFRFSKAKTTSALIMRVNKEKFVVEEELFLESTSLEEIAEELPDNQPRFVLISYRYQSTDGRLSFPMVFIYWSPVCVKPELHMLYAGAKTHIVNVCDCVGKVYDVREEEQLNDEWMREKLAFFR